MSSKPSLLLLSASLVYFLCGLSLVFASVEVLHLAFHDVSALASLLAQLLGAALFGFAMLNWMLRHTIVGGIYGRPLVAANLAHAFPAAMALGRQALDPPLVPGLLVAAVLYAGLAVAFGIKFFATPAAVAGR